MDKLASVKHVLRRLRYFGEMPDAVLQIIAAAAYHRHINAGGVVYLEGEPAESVYILESGWIKATRMTHEGREQAMLFLRPVEVFGDVAVVEGTTYPNTAVALEDADVWVLRAATFLELILHQPPFAMALVRHLGERVVYYMNLVEDLSLRTVEARLASTLLRYAERRQDEIIVPRRGWATFDAMAIRLGTVRDVLRRALKTLEAEGLLRVEKNVIVLLDPKGLQKRGGL